MHIIATHNVIEARRYANLDALKVEGAHYTPRNLASFVAKEIVTCLPRPQGRLTVLDPAVGDGELILALLTALRSRGIVEVDVTGFDTSASALQVAEARVREAFPRAGIQLKCASFLDFAQPYFRQDTSSLFAEETPRFDVVIANPPYVRTQIMGAKQAQQLSQQFNLSGRIDLYHAFLLAIAEVLNSHGIVGIIVSNRFMTTKAGAAVRQDILRQFDVHHVWDLGDTKLFAAAVLPAVLLLEKRGRNPKQHAPRFTSVYSTKSDGPATFCADIVDGLSLSGLVKNDKNERFLLEHGTLEHGSTQTDVWRMRTDRSSDWLATVRAHTWGEFRDIGKVRVGVKTTADKVFIRSDWENLPDEARPELLKPLITHHIARRFRSLDVKRGRKILYPHSVIGGRRCAVPLDGFPRSARYLEQHRNLLQSRAYLTASGREWYEIWVPQDPAAWDSPKLVFRDISAEPTFWIDLEGSVVNGDCYWIPCADAEREDLLWLALAVGNSTFIEVFYDRCFHNKLYAGRRRFMTQYVEHFPLPDRWQPPGRVMIEMTKQIYADPSSPDAVRLARELDVLTWQAFGLSREEAPR